jgi:peptide/nickel transport system substrate-binding protein
MDKHSTLLLKHDKEILSRSLTSGGMTRRQAMKWLTGMGISIVSAGTIVTQLERAFAAETPKRGGRMRVAATSVSVKDTMDPAKFNTASDYIRGYTFYNGLTRFNAKTEAEPELAQSFEPNADATQWVFKLRKGVTFHDGKTLDADDVVYSLMRHKDPNVGSAAKTMASQMSDVKADGKDTVVVKLTGPNADFPIVLAYRYFQIIKNGTTDFTTAIGTGSYKVKEFKPGTRALGVRNENYFHEGRPYMDEMEIIGIGDNNARLNALYAGDVQMITSISPASIPDVESRKDVRLSAVKAPRFTPLNMMVDRPPFQNNPDLRLALKYLFDREKVLKTIYKGYGQIGNDHLFAPEDPFYNTALPVRKLDHDKAKFHLKKAKMEKATLELHVGEAAFGSVELGMMLQVEAAKVGLTIDLKREPSDGYWSNVWRKKSFHAGEWDARPTDDLLLTQGFKSDAVWNETGYKSEKLDKLIDEGRGTLDFAKRKEIYHEIQKIFYEDGTSIVPAFADFIAAVNAKVRGLIPVRTSSLSGANFADSVWMEA